MKLNLIQHLSDSQRDYYLSINSLQFNKLTLLQSHWNHYFSSLLINLYQINITLYRKNLNALVFYLNKSLFQKFNILIDIAVVDFPGKQLRFQITYLFLSLFYNTRISLILYSKEIFPIKSIRNMYSAATWIEREVYDLYGILFSNQKDLRRILTDYAFKGFPLRKDFPLTGYNEISYNDIKKVLCYSKVTLAQEYRVYHFQNPWVNLD